MWTLFWDMHSGGDQKEKWSHIYIEAPQDEAESVFYRRFGHNPNRVTCTCCGPDYSIKEEESLEQLSGFSRNCIHIVKRDSSKDKLYGEILDQRYIESNEEIPDGYTTSRSFGSREYKSLEQYINEEDVLVIYDKDIKPEERKTKLS
mgnify:CR=1 FL=1